MVEPQICTQLLPQMLDLIMSIGYNLVDMFSSEIQTIRVSETSMPQNRKLSRFRLQGESTSTSWDFFSLI